MDDSSGSLGAFGGGLFCGWVTARQAAVADAADTVARLLAWMDNDQYGFCFGIEEDIASALDDAGRAACVAQIKRLLDPEAQHSRGTSAAFDLRELRRDLLVKLGRNEEALQSTWADFGRNPSTYAYDDLMKFVPVKDRASWHEKAIEAAAQPGRCSLPSLIPLLVETKEIKRLAELVDQCTADQLSELGRDRRPSAREPFAQDRIHARLRGDRRGRRTRTRPSVPGEGKGALGSSAVSAGLGRHRTRHAESSGKCPAVITCGSCAALRPMPRERGVVPAALSAPRGHIPPAHPVRLPRSPSVTEVG